MRKVRIPLIVFVFLPAVVFGQLPDSTDIVDETSKVQQDSNVTFHKPFFDMDYSKCLFYSMNYQFDIAQHKSLTTYSLNKVNNDFKDRPIIKREYDIYSKSFETTIIPSPIESKKNDFEKPLPYYKYELPTKAEYDILAVLWNKGNITGSTIYSESDTTLNMTFEDLRTILTKMIQKGWLCRKQVSPSQYFTFRIQGKELPFKIEMSQKNRSNREFLYHSNIEFAKMKDFILANAYLSEFDSSLVYSKQLRAASLDTNLIRYLYNRLLNVD